MKKALKQLKTLPERLEDWGSRLQTVTANHAGNILTELSELRDAVVAAQEQQVTGADIELYLEHFGIEIVRLLQRSDLSSDVADFRRWLVRKHWHSGLQSGRTAEFCETRVSRSLASKLQKGKRHLVVAGKLGSGKSVTARLGIEEFLKTPAAPDVALVLPLSPDFSLKRGWSGDRGCDELNRYLSELTSAERSRHLILVEDAHEGETSSPGEPFEWAGKLGGNLSECTVVVTTRDDAGRLGQVQDRLKNHWGISIPRSSVLRTEPQEAATLLCNRVLLPIKDRSARLEIREDIREFFIDIGRNLYVLDLVLRLWSHNQNRDLDMTLAYEAVAAEVSRIVDGVTDQNGGPKHDAAISLMWIIGGLDMPVSTSFMKNFFGVSLSKKQWGRLVSSSEVEKNALLPANYDVLRHPAWGQLVMKAVDDLDAGELANVSQTLIRGIKKYLASRRDIPKSLRRRSWTAVESVLFAMLQSKKVRVNELSYYCSGKQMHDEFSSAARAYLLCQKARGVGEIEVSEAMLGIASNARRIMPPEIEQWSINLRDGGQMIRDAMKLRRSVHGPSLSGDNRKGYVLYEEGYYKFLVGSYPSALKSFKASVVAEAREAGDRLIYAAMSEVMVANVFLCLGSLDEAEDHAEQAVDWANTAIQNGDAASDEAGRFRGNAYATKFEISLRKRNLKSAEKALASAMVDLRRAGYSPNTSLYNARIQLCKFKPNESKKLVMRIHRDAVAMQTVETFLQAHRVLGDAYLFGGNLAAARAEYDRILPRRRTKLSWEQSLADQRVELLNSTKRKTFSKRALASLTL